MKNPPLLMRMLGKILNLFVPGDWVVELQCTRCGRLIAPERIDAHEKLFHADV